MSEFVTTLAPPVKAVSHSFARSEVMATFMAAKLEEQAVWQEMFDKTGIKLIDGIGSTEMLHVFISAADDDIRPGATGREVPGFRAAILDGRQPPDLTPAGSRA